MNINMIRLKTVVGELRGIRKALERIADCYELELAQQNVYVRPPQPDTSPTDTSMDYEDEAMSWAREQPDFIEKTQDKED